MTPLPLLISVPHGGTTVPPEVDSLCRLTLEQIIKDGDMGAAEIYAFRDQVSRFFTTDIARVIIDLNRAPEDRSRDGVVKTHTCWMEPVYHACPDERTIKTLLEKYYAPYHAQLENSAGSDLLLAIDCHTMAEKGPPVGPDPGAERPWICLSNRNRTCPEEWLKSLGDCFKKTFDGNVRLNDPFKGGFIIQSHCRRMPWVQLEISRAPFMSNGEKKEAVLCALTEWTRRNTT